VLLYFRFRDPHYAVSRLALIAMDTTSLIKSALDDRTCGWLKESVAVTQLWRGSMRLLTALANSFLPEGLPQPSDHPIDEATKDRWRRRYFAACRRLRQADIQTIADEQAGAENYVVLRAKWDRYITSFASDMAHEIDVIDPAGSCPEETDDRSEFRARLRSAG
jgi:hypothetical protein